MRVALLVSKQFPRPTVGPWVAGAAPSGAVSAPGGRQPKSAPGPKPQTGCGGATPWWVCFYRERRRTPLEFSGAVFFLPEFAESPSSISGIGFTIGVCRNHLGERPSFQQEWKLTGGFGKTLVLLQRLVHFHDCWKEGATGCWNHEFRYRYLGLQEPVKMSYPD